MEFIESFDSIIQFGILIIHVGLDVFNGLRRLYAKTLHFSGKKAGPINSVRRPKNDSGTPKPFAFILYKHESAVPYALEIFRNTKLFNRPLKLNSRSSLRHCPVLQTDFSCHNGYQQHERAHRSEDKLHREERHSRSDRHSSEPKSWAEYNSLRGQGVHSKGYHRDDLRRPHEIQAVPLSAPMLHQMTDFNALLQMGQQLMLPGAMGFPSMLPVAPMGLFDFPQVGGGNMFPSMQGRLSGAETGHTRRSDHQEGRSHWRDHHEDRGSRRDHPYNDRRDERRHHDRRYSSSHSSHDREKRDRRSR